MNANSLPSFMIDKDQFNTATFPSSNQPMLVAQHSQGEATFNFVPPNILPRSLLEEQENNKEDENMQPSPIQKSKIRDESSSFRLFESNQKMMNSMMEKHEKHLEVIAQNIALIGENVNRNMSLMAENINKNLTVIAEKMTEISHNLNENMTHIAASILQRSGQTNNTISPQFQTFSHISRQPFPPQFQRVRNSPTWVIQPSQTFKPFQGPHKF